MDKFKAEIKFKADPDELSLVDSRLVNFFRQSGDYEVINLARGECLIKNQHNNYYFQLFNSEIKKNNNISDCIARISTNSRAIRDGLIRSVCKYLTTKNKDIEINIL